MSGLQFLQATRKLHINQRSVVDRSYIAELPTIVLRNDTRRKKFRIGQADELC